MSRTSTSTRWTASSLKVGFCRNLTRLNLGGLSNLRELTVCLCGFLRSASLGDGGGSLEVTVTGCGALIILDASAFWRLSKPRMTSCAALREVLYSDATRDIAVMSCTALDVVDARAFVAAGAVSIVDLERALRLPLLPATLASLGALCMTASALEGTLDLRLR